MIKICRDCCLLLVCNMDKYIKTTRSGLPQYKCYDKEKSNMIDKIKKTKTTKPKKKKLITLPKLLKETQSIVNARARKRDGCCLWCKEMGKHTDKSLQAHHYIVAQGSCSKERFNEKNLITLCYGHHIHGIHKNPTIDNIDMIKRIALKNGIVSEKEMEKIIKSRGSIKKWTREELENIRKSE